MTSIPRDGNSQVALFGVSSVDDVTPVPFTIDPVSGGVLIDAGSVTDELDTRYLQLTNAGDLALLDTITASYVTDFDTEVSSNTDVLANTSARHSAVTIGTNTASALSLSGQELSLADVFVQTAGDTMSGGLTLPNIGIGSAALDSGRIINADKTFGDGGAYGFYSIARVDPDTDNSDFYFGGYLSAQSTSGSTHNAAGFRAIKTFGEHNGTGTIGSIYGAEFQVGNTNTGTISQAVAFKVLAPYNTGGGTITEYMGIELETPSLGRSIVARGGEIIFNDYGNAEADLIVRGDTKYELFKVDTSADEVVIDGSFRMNQTPTSETITPDHTIIINISGTNYKFPCVAA